MNEKQCTNGITYMKNVRQIIFFYANAVIFNRKDICGLRIYHGNCKHGTIAAIFDGIANDLSPVSYTHLDVYKRQTSAIPPSRTFPPCPWWSRAWVSA